jgi:mannose-1-phosphate guanylyltransferase
VSTPARPKQLLPLGTERPLIVDTLERARALAPDERIRVLAPAELASTLATAIPSLPGDCFWREPEARGTAPALAWAAWRIHREDPDAVMVSLHADHVIRPTEAFAGSIREAARIASSERLLVTIGALPDRPEIGFGYVQPGEPLTAGAGFRAARVSRFHEKPDASTAAAYVSRGFLWNTGLFVWPVELFLAELALHAPELGDRLPLLEGDGPGAFFADAPALSVDVAVLERSERVGVLEATFRWDDLGSWEALARTLAADDHGNVAHGASYAVEASGNVVFSEDQPVVLFGVHDLVVVRTSRVTLVATRSDVPHLKRLLDGLPESLRRLE